MNVALTIVLSTIQVSAIPAIPPKHPLPLIVGQIIDLENGGYWKCYGEFPNYKEYKFTIQLNDGPIINGSLKCHAAGTMEDTFDKYDIIH